jgi:hypothetical protein
VTVDVTRKARLVSAYTKITHGSFTSRLGKKQELWPWWFQRRNLKDFFTNENRFFLISYIYSRNKIQRLKFRLTGY